MSTIGKLARTTWWRLVAALTLVIGLLVPLWSAAPVAAQGTLPATAEAAPEGTVLFQVFDLDPEGAQWQLAEALLARVGLPDVIELWEQEVLAEGARKGDFTEADLDALLGGELAVVVTPLAVEMMVQHEMQGEEDSASAAEMMNQQHGISVVLLPSDPDAAWNYVERQIADMASRQDVPVEEVTHGSGELLWMQPPDRRERLQEHIEEAIGDEEITEAIGELIGESHMDMGMGIHGRPGIAAGHAGDYIIAGFSQADVTSIIDVVDGTTGSLADSAVAQEVAAELPAETLSFTYVDGSSVFDALGDEAMANMQAMMPETDEAAWQTQSGLSLSAVDAGFRFDSITVPGESGTLGSMAVANDPALVAAAERIPGDTFFYQAGVLPENALAGAAYGLAAAVNGEMEGMEGEEAFEQMPTAEEIDAQIAQASETLGFDLRTELFDLLGGEFVMYSSLPSFSAEGIGIDAVAAITTSDPTTLAGTAQKVATMIGSAGEDVAVTERQLEGDTVYVVSDPASPEAPSLEFGVVGDQAVVGTEGGLEALAGEPGSSLADSPQFQAVMDFLPDEYYQIAYLDIGQVVDFATMMMGSMEDSQPAGATASDTSGSLANIRAFAAVSFQRDDMAGSSAILHIAE